jgi:hypothetical protein
LTNGIGEAPFFQDRPRRQVAEILIMFNLAVLNMYDYIASTQFGVPSMSFIEGNAANEPNPGVE